MTGIFENDGALDWLNDFVENPEEIKIRSAFRLTGDETNYPDALDCEEALAAAAVVISLYHNKPCAGMPHTSFETILAMGFQCESELRLLAYNSAKHILEQSELKDLWEEDEDYAEWELSIKELIALLQSQ